MSKKLCLSFAEHVGIKHVGVHDLAPHVGASLDVMERDARRMRGGQPFVFTNLMKDDNLDTVIGWIQKYALLEDIAEPAGLVR